jgi:hypothetical protein
MFKRHAAEPVDTALAAPLQGPAPVLAVPSRREPVRRRATALPGNAVTAVVATAILFGVAVRPVLSATVNLVVVDVVKVAEGHRASKLIGSTVKNDKDESIGSIDDMIVGRDRALFAVLQVGGFLGLGGRLVAVPFDHLQVNDAGDKIVMAGATKDELKKLPEFKYLD